MYLLPPSKLGDGIAAADSMPAEEPDVLFEQGNPSIRKGRLEAEKLSESILTNRGALGKVTAQDFRTVMVKLQCHLSRKRKKTWLAGATGCTSDTFVYLRCHSEGVPDERLHQVSFLR